MRSALAQGLLPRLRLRLWLWQTAGLSPGSFQSAGVPGEGNEKSNHNTGHCTNTSPWRAIQRPGIW